MKPKIIRVRKLKEKDYGATKTTDILTTKKFSIARVRKVSNDVKLGGR